MTNIDFITVDGQPVALVAAGRAIISELLAPRVRARAHAKALFALEIQAGERPGPYRDDDAERHAASLLDATHPPGGERDRTGTGAPRTQRARLRQR